MSKLIEAIKRAIEASGKTRYKIAQESGVDQSQLSRLFRGKRGLSIDAAEQLAGYLGLEVIIRPKRRARKVR